MLFDVTVVNEFEEMDDRWLLGWRGLRVEEIRVDFRLLLLFGRDVELAVEQRASVSLGGLKAPGADALVLTPETGDVAGVLPLLRATVLSSVAFKSGTLRIVFSTGHHLNVEPSEQFEAWTAAGPGSSRLVCRPGGGLSVWK